MTIETEYLRFWRDEKAEAGKTTQVWLVVNRHHGFPLGQIRWFGRWRQYVFFPEPDTAFNRQCLADVRGFIGGLMDERRKTGDRITDEGGADHG